MLRSLIILLALSIRLSANMTALYLSWYADPTTTMTICWHTPENEESDTIYLQNTDNQWHAIVGSHEHLRYLLVHTVRLAHLQPNTEYSFRIGTNPTIYKFRTAPDDLTHPIQFIIGGDADHSTKLFRKMNQTIVEKDPLFCVIGGDIAYAIKTTPFRFASSAFNRWISFLSIWKEQMITKEGRIIPLILGAGNHDIEKEDSSLFFTLFPFPEKHLYRSIDFEKYLSLILLDTDHLDPIEGTQTDWLNHVLSERERIPFRLAIYHEAAYPSYYPYHGTIPKKIRTFWCPLFDKYKITAAFENHNHAFKRTHPMTNGEVDSHGIVYFGDGCWGAPPRKTNDMWYLAKRARKNNVYFVTLTEKEASIEAINLIGEVFDSVSITKKDPFSVSEPQAELHL